MNLLRKYPKGKRLGVRIDRDDLAKLLGIANGSVFAIKPFDLDYVIGFAIEMKESETNATPNEEYQKLLDKFLADIDHISASNNSS